MPTILSRGIKTPVTYHRNFISFYEGGEPGRGWDNNQFTALESVHIPEQIPLQLLLLHLLEFAGIQRKIIRMILTICL
jgi:hypothetical protein